jgi:hypothetical protein
MLAVASLFLPRLPFAFAACATSTPLGSGKPMSSSLFDAVVTQLVFEGQRGAAKGKRW